MKKLLKRLGVLLLGMILAGFLAEGMVLLLLGEQVKFPRHVVGAPFGVRINLPGAEYRHKSPDVDVHFAINAQGMRADVDFPYEKPPGRLRILSLGDSFTIGYEVEQEDCFSAVLERELRAKGYDVDVLNCGVSGYSSAEACLYLERELIKYDPDLVLISFYQNDVRDNVRSGLFEVSPTGELIQKKDSYVPLGGFADFLNTSKVFSLLSQYSNAFSFLKNETTNLLKNRMVEEQVENAATERGIDIDEWNEKVESMKRASQSTQILGQAAGTPDERPRRERDPDKAVNRPVIRTRVLVCKIYERMYRFLHERGIPFVVHSIPYESPIEETGGVELLDAFPAACFDSDREGVDVLYSKQVLDPLHGEHLLYWKRSNRHWTPIAHEAAGKMIAEHIDGAGLLKK